MLTIRLSRVGKKKHPVYRVIVSEKQKDTVGDYLELLGHYDPHTNKAELKAERIKHWVAKGARASGTVHNLLVENKLIDGKKIKVANIKKKEVEPEKKQVSEEKKEKLIEAKKEAPEGTVEKKEATPAEAKTEELPAPEK